MTGMIWQDKQANNQTSYSGFLITTMLRKSATPAIINQRLFYK
jgi:hypothetical protein